MWKKIFKAKKISTEETTKKPIQILFEIDNSDKFTVDLIINDKSVEMADNLGLLLFLINEGYYVQYFLDMLTDLSKQDSNNGIFVQKTISNWSNKIVESENNHIAIDEPIIKPSQFGVGK